MQIRWKFWPSTTVYRLKQPRLRWPSSSRTSTTTLQGPSPVTPSPTGWTFVGKFIMSILKLSGSWRITVRCCRNTFRRVKLSKSWQRTTTTDPRATDLRSTSAWIPTRMTRSALRSKSNTIPVRTFSSLKRSMNFEKIFLRLQRAPTATAWPSCHRCVRSTANSRRSSMCRSSSRIPAIRPFLEHRRSPSSSATSMTTRCSPDPRKSSSTTTWSVDKQFNWIEVKWITKKKFVATGSSTWHGDRTRLRLRSGRLGLAGQEVLLGHQGTSQFLAQPGHGNVDHETRHQRRKVRIFQ